MIYAKNLPAWERGVRVIAGVGLMITAVVAGWGSLLGWALMAGGTMAVVTAFAGVCPMCAMVGRRTPT